MVQLIPSLVTTIVLAIAFGTACHLTLGIDYGGFEWVECVFGLMFYVSGFGQLISVITPKKYQLALVS
jgi:hypothetical protein